MRIARFTHDDHQHWGFVDEGEIAVASGALEDVLSGGREAEVRARSDATFSVSVDEVDLLAPLPNPPQFFGIGLNYRAHAEEAGLGIPTVPISFGFHTTAIIGPGDPIEIPTFSEKVDWEVELAIVIGRPGRDIPLDKALDHVAGYTIVNDVSARDVQFAERQWTRAKSFDTFKPMGPWIVTTSELGRADDLAIRSSVNGVLKQSSSTSDLVFGVEELVSRMSEAMTLLPGAVIATGTPSGVGFAREPAEFLQPGDTVTMEIEGIGVLTNPVVAG